jgi:hypothetical protein
MEFVGTTLDQYDQVIGKMGFEPKGQGAVGGLFHWVAATDGGIRVVDVWETKELFEAFGAETLGPITHELGIAPPEMTFLEVHNYLTKG